MQLTRFFYQHTQPARHTGREIYCITRSSHSRITLIFHSNRHGERERRPVFRLFVANRHCRSSSFPAAAVESLFFKRCTCSSSEMHVTKLDGCAKFSSFTLLSLLPACLPVHQCSSSLIRGKERQNSTTEVNEQNECVANNNNLHIGAGY